MSSLSLFHSIGSPVNVISEPVLIPASTEEGYGIVILAAPPSELNIFDITVGFDSKNNGEWMERDNTVWSRGLNDAEQSIYYTVSVRLDLTGIEAMRVRINTGDCIVAVAVMLEITR